jgi:hypothetical protein
VDFAFIKVALKDLYVDWGRDPWDPVLMFKLVFLQFFYYLSDRQLEERATWDLMFKCFLDLSAEELPPVHSTLSASACAWGPRASRGSSTRWWSRPEPRDWSPTGCTSSMPAI